MKVAEIIEEFKTTGTEVEHIQHIEVEGIHILGMQFSGGLSDTNKETIEKGITKLFEDQNCIVILLDKDDNFYSLTRKHRDYFEKLIGSHS